MKAFSRVHVAMGKGARKKTEAPNTLTEWIVSVVNSYQLLSTDFLSILDA